VRSWPGAPEFTLNEAEPAQMRALAGTLRSPRPGLAGSDHRSIDEWPDERAPRRAPHATDQTVQMVTLPPGQQGGVPCGRGLVGIGRDSSSRHVSTPPRSSPRV
jgi:hypothetical protein